MVLKSSPLTPYSLLVFEEIEVGNHYLLEHTITEADVNSFAKLTGDFNPVHLDHDFALRTPFGKPIVHGLLTASFISTMIGMLIPGPGALWLSQTIEFLNPAFVGDKITVKAVLKRKSPATRILILDIVIENQNGTQLVQGESTVRMLRLTDQADEVSMNTNKEVVLITGGSRGIGAATAVKLAIIGHPVVINFLHAEKEAAILVRQIESAGGRAVALQGDVSLEEDVDKVFSQAEQAFGVIRSVVHCAAPNPIPQSFDVQIWNTYQSHLDIQLRGAFNCAHRALPAMVEHESGSFIFLGSIFGQGIPPLQQSPYVVAKAALAAFARTLAVEYGPKGIRVNTVAPGMTQTEMIASIPDKTKLLAKMNTPLRRLAEPNDIAEVIAFLVSPAARHITGITLPVCGGLVM